MKELLLRDAPWLLGHLHYFEEIDSTNIYAKELARDAKLGSIVIAERQTAGRGRLGRSFSSPSGWGLYISFVLPNLTLTASPTIYGGAIVARVLSRLYGEDFGIKWVNDILLKDKKICGILAENTGNAVVMGIGINLNTPMDFFGEELPNAGSVGGILGIKCELNKVAAELSKEFLCYSSGDSEYLEELFAYYKNCLVTLGREVVVISSTETFNGRAVDILEDGSLIVNTENGTRTVAFGDVSVRGINGYI